MIQEPDSPQTFHPGDSPDFQAVPTSPIQDFVEEILVESVDKFDEDSVAAAVEDALQTPIRKEIEAIYLDLPEDILSELDAGSKPEVIASPASRELYALADEIIKARKELL
jgi:thiamine pyrophosphate-dependent acetolactate synthase large subunit-like protein